MPWSTAWGVWGVLKHGFQFVSKIFHISLYHMGGWIFYLKFDLENHTIMYVPHDRVNIITIPFTHQFKIMCTKSGMSQPSIYPLITLIFHPKNNRRITQKCIHLMIECYLYRTHWRTNSKSVILNHWFLIANFS